ncbi:alpha-ketoglutarate-dependent dioxygenase AlkB [Nostoc sp.]|uniref:alpha-ketoglutarate-dependent dioxygenase AlkB n=1 Tax=Nostoc sp. TaxID=1180 RepID=UPI002FF4D94D
MKTKKNKASDSNNNQQINTVKSSPDIQQLELNLVFEVSKQDSSYKIVEINEINGLKYIPEFITQSKHDYLLQKLDDKCWLSDFKRRVQHYGYKYNYKARIIDTSMQIGALPDWALELAYKLYENNLIDTLPDQVIVNEYLPGQGITSHIDCVPCFTDTIISLSLGSFCIMNFTNVLTGEKIPILLEPKSIVILKEDARYKWTHSIAPRKVDKFRGQVIRRERRVSLTFRKVILAG